MALMVDPPEGWKYGFPKAIPLGTTDVMAWLIEQGYPQKLMDELGDNFFCRYWEEI